MGDKDSSSSKAANSKVAPAGSPKAKSATECISDYQHMRAADERLFPLVVFPEGSTKSRRCLYQFRTGAFVSGEPVQPVVLLFPDKHVDISWTNQSIAYYLFRLLTQWTNRATMIWLP